jgi:hypothetical protein
MPPGGGAEAASVVVRISRPRETIVRYLVPFFARDLARFATDAHGWISEETNLHIFLHVIVAALVRALCSFTDHVTREFVLVRVAHASRVLGFGVAPKQSFLWIS